MRHTAAALVAAATIVVVAARWRRRRRRHRAAVRYARDLLCDPRIKRSLVPYPSKATTRRLAALTGLSAQQVRKVARGARSGRCARPWHGEAPAEKRCETFARRRHFYFLFHKPAAVRQSFMAPSPELHAIDATVTGTASARWRGPSTRLSPELRLLDGVEAVARATCETHGLMRTQTGGLRGAARRVRDGVDDADGLRRPPDGVPSARARAKMYGTGNAATA